MVVGWMLHHHLALGPGPDPVENPVTKITQITERNAKTLLIAACATDPHFHVWLCIDQDGVQMDMYVRHSTRMYDGKPTKFFDVANVIAEPKGTGLFTLCMRVLEAVPVNIYVENV